MMMNMLVMDVGSLQWLRRWILRRIFCWGKCWTPYWRLLWHSLTVVSGTFGGGTLPFFLSNDVDVDVALCCPCCYCRCYHFRYCYRVALPVASPYHWELAALR